MKNLYLATAIISLIFISFLSIDTANAQRAQGCIPDATALRAQADSASTGSAVKDSVYRNGSLLLFRSSGAEVTSETTSADFMTRYKKASATRATGEYIWGYCIGFGAGWAGASALVSLIKGQPISSNDMIIAGAAAGLGLLIGVPVELIGAGKLNRLARSHNSDAASGNTVNGISLSIGAQPGGIGLALKF